MVSRLIEMSNVPRSTAVELTLLFTQNSSIQSGGKHLSVILELLVGNRSDDLVIDTRGWIRRNNRELFKSLI